MQPVGKEQAEDQAVEDVLAEVERHQRFSSVLAVGVDAEGDGRGGAKGATKGNNAEEDGGDNPKIVFLGRPAKAHQANCGGDGDGGSHDQAKLGFVDSPIASAHVTYDDVGHFAGDCCSKDAADERR